MGYPTKYTTKFIAKNLETGNDVNIEVRPKINQICNNRRRYMYGRSRCLFTVNECGYKLSLLLTIFSRWLMVLLASIFEKTYLSKKKLYPTLCVPNYCRISSYSIKINTCQVKVYSRWSVYLLTHICVCNLTIIGPNKKWPGRGQAIIWTNTGMLLIGHLGGHFSEILIEIHTFSFKKIHSFVCISLWKGNWYWMNEVGFV